MNLGFRPLLVVSLIGFATASSDVRGEPPAGAPLEVVQKLPATVAPGVPFVVEVAVNNHSPQPVEGIQVIDTLPAGYEAQAAVPTPEPSQDRLTWLVARLGPGEERRFQLTLIRKSEAAPPLVRNAVEVAYPARVSSVAVTRIAGPELALDVQPAQAAAVGEPTTLWITACNHGTVAARNVSLQTLLPPQLSHARGSDLEMPLEGLDPGASRRLPLQVTPGRAGEFRVRVSLVAEGAAPVVREVPVYARDIRLALAARGPETLPQTLTGLFELAVRNDGDACAVSVLVLLPEGMAFARASDRGVYDPQTHSIRWDLGELRPAATRVLAWNGSPQKAGDMACKVRLLSGDRVRQEASCAVRVLPGGDASRD
jgi:uncharacterized repeat protein (TIGR01451 family)